MKKMGLFGGAVFLLGSSFVFAQQPAINPLADQIKALADQIKALNLPVTPVDCVVSEPTLQSWGLWGTCVNGQQSRTETWAMSVLTPASNGGLACPSPLTVARTGTQPCTVTPPGAGPVIGGTTGALTHGATLTLTGSRFGSHASYGGSQAFLNAGWHDFENGSFTGGNLELERDFSPEQWSLSTAVNRSNSTRHALKRYINNRLGEYGLRENSGGMSGTTGTFFVSFWTQLSGAQAEGKLFRIYGGSGDIFLAQGGSDLTIRGFSSCGGCSPTPTSVWGSPNSYQPNTWHRVDVQMRDKSQGQADYFAVYLDGVRQWQRGSGLPSKHNDIEGSSNNEREQWVPSTFGGNGHTVAVGQMIEPGSATYRFDDVFVDYTWARVEIGNNSVYANCTQKEIQIPQAWSSGTIAVKVNRGGFSSLSGQYLFVVDSTGAVSPGYRLN